MSRTRSTVKAGLMALVTGMQGCGAMQHYAATHGGDIAAGRVLDNVGNYWMTQNLENERSRIQSEGMSDAARIIASNKQHAGRDEINVNVYGGSNQSSQVRQRAIQPREGVNEINPDFRWLNINFATSSYFYDVDRDGLRDVVGEKYKFYDDEIITLSWYINSNLVFTGDKIRVSVDHMNIENEKLIRVLGSNPSILEARNNIRYEQFYPIKPGRLKPGDYLMNIEFNGKKVVSKRFSVIKR